MVADWLALLISDYRQCVTRELVEVITKKVYSIASIFYVHDAIKLSLGLDSLIFPTCSTDNSTMLLILPRTIQS